MLLIWSVLCLFRLVCFRVHHCCGCCCHCLQSYGRRSCHRHSLPCCFCLRGHDSCCSIRHPQRNNIARVLVTPAAHACCATRVFVSYPIPFSAPPTKCSEAFLFDKKKRARTSSSRRVIVTLKNMILRHWELATGWRALQAWHILSVGLHDLHS